MNRIQRLTENCSHSPLLDMLSTAGEAALAAGEILRSLYDKPHDIQFKGEIDLVTEADIAAERKILDLLRQKFPDIRILAEESHSDYSSIPDEPVWIIDPLDGTTNFAHSFPWFAVSIAYAENGESKVGVIYAPMLDELFCAGKGCGAWLNGQEIKVSNAEKLSRSLLATGFPYDVREKPEQVINALQKIITRSQGIRRAGAAALDLAYVACGRLDGFWEIKLKPWDTAAGILLVKEAGGTVTDFNGGPYTPFLPEIASSNSLIHDELVSNLVEFHKQQ